MKVFITGATGFLGFHIARACMANGHDIICLHRPASVNPFSENENRHITWITEEEARKRLGSLHPEVLVHAAWGGVSAAGRNDKEIQQANIEMTQRIMELYPYRQIIMLGSQDEYGRIDKKVDERQPVCPLSEYAKAKVACSRMLEAYSAGTKAEWQWIRIFSIYGEHQQSCWLIPSVIDKCLNGESFMDTTPGEQIYSYLYCADFAEAIASCIGQKGKSGIYNLSSSHPIALKDLFSLIKELTGSSIGFRATMPYRENQSMVILGDSDKFAKAFGTFEHTSLETGLTNVIREHRISVTEQKNEI